MTIDDLHFEEQCNGGICADFFNINSRYHGYTYEHDLFHVTDSNDYSITSYDENELDSALRSGHFENGNTINSNNNNSIVPGSIIVSNDTGMRFSADNNWIKPVFFGGIIFMLIYLATNKG